MAGDMPADPPGDPDLWVSIREAARRLGVTRAAIYSRIERGTLLARPHGNRGQLVRLPPDMQANVPADREKGALSDMTPGMSGQHAALQAERDRLTDEVERWRSLAEERGQTQARAEVENARLAAELEGERRLNAELRRQLERELARGKRLEIELTEARAPLLTRLLRLLRHES
jgi:hypothetical protein